jgi:hypothetical protein
MTTPGLFGWSFSILKLLIIERHIFHTKHYILYQKTARCGFLYFQQNLFLLFPVQLDLDPAR